ncbi:MAG: response regulator [Acetivibrionales bacterium]|jgi:DNA-binding response OmpR family regulator
MAKKEILVVDDEIEIGELLTLYLSKSGFGVSTATTGFEALSLTSRVNPDLIILDINLPDIDGIELCQQLRQKTEVPIIFLSCKSDDMDIILGLTVGGDDYITKPFSPGELVARVKAHFRRDRIFSLKREQHNEVLNFKGLSIDLSSHIVTVDGQLVKLPAKEFDLLVLLASHPNVVFSIDQIYDSIWGLDNIGDTRTVMVHISNLRRKIEQDPRRPKYITTIKSVGYKFSAQQYENRQNQIEAIF